MDVSSVDFKGKIMPKNQNETKKIINNYWLNKEERKMSASDHHRLMMETQKEAIKSSVNRSKIYSFLDLSFERGNPKQIFKNTDSVSALFDISEDGKICLLNFASFKHPGGGFMNGSSAQEESLCHESILYEVISDEKFRDYYDWNNKHLNRGLYHNRAIYSPDVLFFRNGQTRKADVITCAAPNITAAYQYQGVDDDENFNVLRSRMQFIADIMAENKVNIAILGGFGCGVFGQFPEDVADIWKNLYYGDSMNLIIHPVIGAERNVEVFKDTFK